MSNISQHLRCIITHPLYKNHMEYSYQLASYCYQWLHLFNICGFLWILHSFQLPISQPRKEDISESLALFCLSSSFRCTYRNYQLLPVLTLPVSEVLSYYQSAEYSCESRSPIRKFGNQSSGTRKSPFGAWLRVRFYGNIRQGLAVSAVRSSLYQYSRRNYDSVCTKENIKSDFHITGQLMESHPEYSSA